MASPSTILDATMLCRRTFKAATKYSGLMKLEWAENRLADFKLWAKGAGALAPGRASLDQRLASSPDTHNIILNLLVMLSMLVEDCIATAINADHARSEREFDLPSEELKRMKEVDDNLSQLTRVMFAVRKAGTRSRLEKADASFDASSPPLRSFRRHLEILLLVRPGEDQTSDSAFQELDQERLTTIQLRLIDANIRRRNRFLYAQQHAQKLARRPRPRNDVPPRRGGPQALHLEQHRPPSTIVQTTWITESAPSNLPDQSATTATILEGPVILPTKEVVTPAATTVLSVTTSRILYPAAPPIRNYQGVFRCPCCCQSLPAAVAQGRQWKKHLMGDVIPYVCILTGCPHPLRLYLTKDEWTSHMADDHESSSQWVCQLCSQKSIHLIFERSNDLAAHLAQIHSQGIKPTQIPTLLSAWERRIPVQVLGCPLCDFQADQPSVVLDHAAEHIHTFALRSLPWPPNECLYGDDGDSDNHDPGYFNGNPYFDSNSSLSELSSNSLASSSTGTTTEKYRGSDMDNDGFLTEDALRSVPQQETKHEDTSGWLEGLNTDLPERSRMAPIRFDYSLGALSKEPKHERQNEYFIPGDEINREVIQADICIYLGNDALVRTGNHNGRDGYFLRAYRNLTSEHFQALKDDSVKWENRLSQRQTAQLLRLPQGSVTSRLEREPPDDRTNPFRPED